MDEFVNPKKRGFLLPYGMKDLIDVLRRKPGASAQHASALPFGLAGGHAETHLGCGADARQTGSFGGFDSTDV